MYMHAAPPSFLQSISVLIQFTLQFQKKSNFPRMEVPVDDNRNLVKVPIPLSDQRGRNQGNKCICRAPCRKYLALNRVHFLSNRTGIPARAVPSFQLPEESAAASAGHRAL